MFLQSPAVKVQKVDVQYKVDRESVKEEKCSEQSPNLIIVENRRVVQVEVQWSDQVKSHRKTYQCR